MTPPGSTHQNQTPFERAENAAHPPDPQAALLLTGGPLAQRCELDLF